MRGVWRGWGGGGYGSLLRVGKRASSGPNKHFRNEPVLLLVVEPDHGVLVQRACERMGVGPGLQSLVVRMVVQVVVRMMEVGDGQLRWDKRYGGGSVRDDGGRSHVGRRVRKGHRCAERRQRRLSRGDRDGWRRVFYGGGLNGIVVVVPVLLVLVLRSGFLRAGGAISVGDLDRARVGVDIDERGLVRLQVAGLQPSPSELARVGSSVGEVLRDIFPAHFLDLFQVA